MGVRRPVNLEASVALVLGDLDLDADLRLEGGRTIALVGPNGAGKTTLLRALAGLQPVQRGRVVLGGEVLEDPGAGVRRAPEHRPVGVVFQDYLLFPHLSARDNVAFGLRCRGTRRTEAAAQAGAWLDRVGLGDRHAAMPAELSGGQAQRVALARALAVRPRLLLLDEPLSALDATARVEVRHQLRRQLTGFGGVRLLVTHDPVEALALADELVVLEAGRVVQRGGPHEVTARPRSRYVADLVGVNLYRGTGDGRRVRIDSPAGQVFTVAVTGTPAGEVFALVHPRAVSLHRRRPEGTPRNVWPGTADGLDFEGERVRVQVGGPLPVVAEVTPAAVSELGLAGGGEVWVSVKAAEVEVYPA